MAEKEKKQNPFVRFFMRAGKFFRDTKGEIKKIVWPTPKATFKNTGIVLVAMLIIGALIFGIDQLFMNLLNLVMGVAKS